MGIPAGNLLQKRGYKFTALAAVGVGFTGVGVQTIAGLLSGDLAFGIYLLGAFIAGFSMCMLNIVVNPMLNKLAGGGNRGNQLLQVGGSFNSLMGTAVIFLTGVFVPSIANAEIKQVFPLMFIALAIFALAFVVIIFTNIPESKPEATANQKEEQYGPMSFRHFMLGAVAIFIYVGVEVGIPGTMNFFLTDTLGTANAATTAGFVAGTYWLLMLVGRFVSSLISGKVSSRAQLAATSGAAIVLVILAMFTTDVPASMPVFTGSGFEMANVPLTALLLVLCGLCTSVMWGAIFNLAVEGLGAKSAAASGLFMTMVIGGGILPLVQGAIADATSYMTSYWLPVAALAYICWFALLGSKVKKA
jgi:FHS family L-fucose permease-like MFS transporter